MSEINNMIECKEVSYIYSEDNTHTGNKAIDNVSFDIKKGEFVVILGRNGSGKSTMAKHMNALLLPSRGKVYVAGLDTSDEKETWNIRSRAGMVFQNPDNQLVASVVEEDVAFGPENVGVDPKDRRL